MEMQVKQPSEVALSRRQAIMDLQGAVMASEQSVAPATFVSKVGDEACGVGIGGYSVDYRA